MKVFQRLYYVVHIHHSTGSMSFGV